MTLWTAKRVRQLRKGSGDAMARLVRLADDTSLDKPKAGLFAWGQFLDAPRNVEQYGLFGTAAAICLLVEGGYTQQHRKIEQSRAWLPELEPLASGPAVLDKTDLGLTFKCAAVLSAAAKGPDGDYVREEPIQSHLLGKLVEGKGWGNFFYSRETDTTARVLPTAHALLALRPSHAFRTSKVCVNILEWLSQTVTQRRDLRPHELAMAGLALQAYPGPGVDVSGYDEALAAVTRRLIRWTRERSPARDDEVSSYHYVAPTGPGGSQHTHYMFYLPNILAARFFLGLSSVPPETRPYVLDVVQRTVDNVKANSGFKSAGSEQVGTIDQFEVHELLRAYSAQAADPSKLLPTAVGMVSGTRTRRVIATVLLLTVALLATGFTAWSDASIVLKAIGGVVAAMATGLLAALWYSWVGGE